MKLFLDTANVEEIRQAAALGVISGVTTNPTIISREGKEFKAVLREIVEIIGDGYVFGEVISLEADGMVEEGRELAKLHSNFVVKLPICAEGLKAASRLSKEGIQTCMTLMFSAAQALLAANAGATFVAPFVGRVDDIAWDGVGLISEIAQLYSTQAIDTKILVASSRSPLHVTAVAKAGADVATLPYKVLLQMIEHPLTKNGLEQFMKDWEKVPK